MADQSLHVIQISFFNDPAGRLPAQLLEAWPTLVDVAEAASGAGVHVSVVQACSHSERLERNGVRYYFLPFGHQIYANRPNEVLRELLRSLAPDVLHVHGLGFLRDTLSLRELAPAVPIILQDHANRPPRIWWRSSWRRGLAVAAGISFCALEQAQSFVKAGLIHRETQLYEVPESTCRFSPGDQQEARRLTAVTGDPALLWVGHLDVNKDPLTVLTGISAVARELPNLQLYCCFGTAPLLVPVQKRIAIDPNLRDRVHFIGRVPHERIETLMRAADIFVLGSHREGSGYSLIEALACGLLPVVTDIPSFRTLTADGAAGILWPCGDTHGLTEALRSAAGRVGPGTRAAVRAHFDRELSFDSVGRKLAAMYQDVITHQRGAVRHDASHTRRRTSGS